MGLNRPLARSIFCLLLLLVACAGESSTPTPAVPGPPASHQELARHYAPVIHQGAASDQDFITAADFDGDWVGSNNWENQPTGDLSAHVYYSVIESETHWFLFYSLFHPRDYTEDPCEKSGGCHENDLESIQVVLEKDGTPFGRIVAMETLAHSHIYLYAVGYTAKKGALRVSSQVTLEDGHPVVWVETYGHGIYGKKLNLKPSEIVYRGCDAAEVPDSLDSTDACYLLVPIYDTLWQHRGELGPGKAFDRPFSYRAQILPAAFDGKDYGEDKANTPWGYDQEIGDVLERGDFFLDPARALAYHATFDDPFSLEYLHNPYLADLGLLDGP